MRGGECFCVVIAMLYASDYNIIFNVSKSKCIHFSPKGHNRKVLGGIPIFSVCSQPIEMEKAVVSSWSYYFT